MFLTRDKQYPYGVPTSLAKKALHGVNGVATGDSIFGCLANLLCTADTCISAWGLLASVLGGVIG